MPVETDGLLESWCRGETGTWEFQKLFPLSWASVSVLEYKRALPVSVSELTPHDNKQ